MDQQRLLLYAYPGSYILPFERLGMEIVRIL